MDYLSIADKLTCKICMVKYDENKNIPCVLHCGHSICKICIRELSTRDDFSKCPFCKKSLPKNIEPVLNYEILSLLHHEHILENSCAFHKKEVLNFFCDDDQCLICQTCLLESHMGHKISKPNESDVSNYLKSLKEFETFERDISYKNFKIHSDIKAIFKEIDDTHDNFLNMVKEIKNLIKMCYFEEFYQLSENRKAIKELNKYIKTHISNTNVSKQDSKQDSESTFKEVLLFIDNELIKLKESMINIKSTCDSEEKVDLSKNKEYKNFEVNVVEKFTKIISDIKSRIDTSELTNPSYYDIENPVEFILEGRKPSSIRYKITSSQQNITLMKAAVLRCNCSDESVLNVLSSIDRIEFVSDDQIANAYNDSPLKIGWNTTISAPHMHTFTLNYIKNFADKFKEIKCIDIGTGSGFMTLALSKILGPKSITIGLDHMIEVLDFTKKNISKSHKQYIDSGRIRFVCKDGFDGYKDEAPYHFIHVGAGCKEVPQELINQLEVGGWIWIPIGPKQGSKKIMVVSKEEDGSIKKLELMDVNYSDMSTIEEQMNPPLNSGGSGLGGSNFIQYLQSIVLSSHNNAPNEDENDEDNDDSI